MALAEEAQLLCLPMPGNSQAGFSVQCNVVNGVVQGSCSCGAGFLLVDRTRPSEIPGRPVSQQ